MQTKAIVYNSNLIRPEKLFKQMSKLDSLRTYLQSFSLTGEISHLIIFLKTISNIRVFIKNLCKSAKNSCSQEVELVYVPKNVELNKDNIKKFFAN